MCTQSNEWAAEAQHQPGSNQQTYLMQGGLLHAQKDQLWRTKLRYIVQKRSKRLNIYYNLYLSVDCLKAARMHNKCDAHATNQKLGNS